jgi:hypothetical protein
VIIEKERLRIASNGNIGIGTNNPIDSFHLHKNATTADVRMIISDNTTTTGALRGFHIGKASTNDVFFWNHENSSMQFATNNSERLRIASNGNIGIWNTNPQGKLHIGTDAVNQGYGEILISVNNGVGSRTFKMGWDNEFYYNLCGDYTGGGQNVWATKPIRCHWTVPTNCIYISGVNGIVNFGFGSANASDIRIKKDIEDINDVEGLNKILLIEPKKYNYVETCRNRGFGKVYGFIAQQIREVIPEAIILLKQIIPNIYKSCLINNKREVYQSIPLDIPIDTSVKIDNNDCYKIKEIYEDYFVIDKDIEADEAFVYGYSVDDFHTLDKTYIFTLNVCATQELHRRIEAQNVVIKSQDDRIKELEMKMERLLSNT